MNASEICERRCGERLDGCQSDRFVHSLVIPIVGAALVWLGAAAHALPTSAAEPVDYERDVRTLLRERCVACHGPVKQLGDLRLDAGALILKGGERPVVAPGDSRHSELIRRVTSDDENERMPPEGARLSGAQIETLRRWIDAGATYPKDEPTPRSPKEHWSFQPVVAAPIPQVRDVAWVRNPIDAFVLAKRERDGLSAPAIADRPTLLRRIYLDLVGLPPSADEQDAARAPEQVVDDLLERPEYGERWARHWLDVVRYADSNGYERDAEKPFVWRYRDYVIDSLNRDKPFDRFVVEQLAGDELPDNSLETAIAAGFLRLGHWDDEPADPATDRYDQLDDMVSATGQAFLGLTIGCARCHDHKFEPLTTRDYYGMVAVFQPLERPRNGRTEQTVPVKGGEVYAWREASAKPPQTHVLLRGSPSRPGEPVAPSAPAILTKRPIEFSRADDATGAADGDSADGAAAGATSTGRRLGLARWIASGENPLTARVIVNRAWQQHFGQGLVTTANDFGLIGAPPSHPELLDWLAHWFVHDARWSLKKLHRLILGSNAWRSVHSPDSPTRYRRLEVETIRDSMLAVSGELNRRRHGPAVKLPIPKAALEANTDKEKIWQAAGESEASRRSIYAFIKRGLVVPLFESLDLADTVVSCPQRQVTTVAPQALSLFNGDFVNRQAAQFAARLRREAGERPDAQIALAWRLALSREPTATESARMQAFLGEASLEQACRVLLNLNEFVYPE